MGPCEEEIGRVSGTRWGHSPSEPTRPARNVNAGRHFGGLQPGDDGLVAPRVLPKVALALVASASV